MKLRRAEEHDLQLYLQLCCQELAEVTMKTRMLSLSRFCDWRGSAISRSCVVLVSIHADSLDAPSVGILSLTSLIPTWPKSSKTLSFRQSGKAIREPWITS